MIRSIERLVRLLPARPMVPVMMLVVGVSVTPDPTRRATGYGGVLPVPTASPAIGTSRRIDPLLDQQRRDVRAARGRVLYSADRTSETAMAKATPRHPCPDRRVVEGRSGIASPAS
jgi:hypothetical protein